MSDQKIYDILNDVYGYSSFRGQQEEIIQSVISGNDTLVIMPTGGGKSLCYQIPALALDGLTIVVSPLIALMDDQIGALKQLGVEAATLHSHISDDEKRLIHHKIKNKQLKLLYLSPEKINSLQMIDYLRSQEVSLIAIDEAHCVSVWGNDFRPDYVRLGGLKEFFPNVPIVALTATADNATQEDIVQQLRMNKASKFLSSFERTNIMINAYPSQKRYERILKIIDQHPDECGIIYCLSRKDTERISEKLCADGLIAEHYHAGLDKLERARIQRDFQNDKCDIICATVAFGMGIDKPNVRYVIHYNMPKNIEAYYQEIGRAGRDGDDSEAHMFYGWQDNIQYRKFIDMNTDNADFQTIQYAKLDRMWEYASTSDCRTNGILAYFGEFREEGCGHCDNCLNPQEKIEGTVLAQKAISAIRRTGQQIGVEMLIDILRASHKKELIDRGYDKIKTFGAGRDLPKNVWQYYIVQLVNKGIISVDYKDGSKLKATPLAIPVLKGEVSVKLSSWVFTDNKKDKKSHVGTPSKSSNWVVDEALLKKLKAWRSSVAKENKVPAFMILSDKVLKEISGAKPIKLDQLLTINGIGTVKLERFGQDIIRIVRG